MVGDLAGGGLVALPTAIVQLGFVIGMILAAVMNVVVMATAYMLGVSWNVLVRRWPEYRTHCRKVAFTILLTKISKSIPAIPRNSISCLGASMSLDSFYLY